MPPVKDCGLITRMSANLLPPGCLQSVNNIYFDKDWSMLRRNGYSAYNVSAVTGAQPIRGLWPFKATDGTNYIIAYSTGTMFYSSGNGAFTAIPGLQNLSTSAEMECVQALGYLNCTNGSDTPFRTNVASTQTLSSAPFGTHIGTFRNRIVIAGVSGTQTQLYLSGELDPTDWTLNLFPNLSTSPVQINISGTNDGSKINCLMGQFQGQFLAGRDYDLYALGGYDNRDFTLRKVSDQIGCIEPKSVQEVNNVLHWVSKRGVEGYTGTQIIPVSYTIDPTIRQIIAASGNSRSQLLTTQADWQSGNLSASGPGAPVSATISPANIVPSSWTVTESTTQFVTGTLVNIDTYAVPGSISLIQGATAAFTNAGGESSDSTTNWPSNGFTNISDSSMFGSRSFSQATSFSCPISITFSIVTSTNGIYSSSTVYISNGMGATSLSIDTSKMQSNTQKLAVTGYCSGGGCSAPSALSKLFVKGTGISLKYKDGDSSASCYPSWDADESQIITTGTYTETRYDTGFSTPTFGPLAAIISSSTAGSIVFGTKVSATSGGALDDAVAVSNGSKIGSAQKRYIVTVASFSVTTATDTPPSMSVLALEAATTAYYITQCVTVSTPASWGRLDVNGVNNGGAFSFWISTGASCGAATASTATWNAQNPNSQIVVTTNTTTVAARALFSVDAGTQTPTLNDITFNWNTGSNRPPVSSVEYLDRYYLFYTTSTLSGAKNDHAAVYDYNNKWTLLDDVNAYSAAKYLNQPFLGDSAATGTIYQFDSGNSDNGGNFTMSFQTADLDMGNPAQQKSFKRAYLFLGAPANPSQSVNLNCSYTIDGSSTSYSFPPISLSESPEQSGYFVAKLPYPIGQATTGFWTSLGCSYTGSDGPVRIYGLRMIYENLSWK